MIRIYPQTPIHLLLRGHLEILAVVLRLHRRRFEFPEMNRIDGPGHSHHLGGGIVRRAEIAIIIFLDWLGRRIGIGHGGAVGEGVVRCNEVEREDLIGSAFQ